MWLRLRAFLRFTALSSFSTATLPGRQRNISSRATSSSNVAAFPARLTCISHFQNTVNGDGVHSVRSLLAAYFDIQAVTPKTRRYPPDDQSQAPSAVPAGPPSDSTNQMEARRKVRCSGREISVMKAAMPMLKVMWPPDSATGRFTENRRYSWGAISCNLLTSWMPRYSWTAVDNTKHT